MVDESQRAECRNPDPAKQATTIARWRYEVVRDAILAVLGERPDGVEFRALSGLVRERLPAATLRDLGSVSWYTVTVKLDLEARGEVERLERDGRQVVRRIS